MIKFIVKWLGFVKGAFSAYRILFIIGGLVVGIVTVQHYRIKSKTKKIEKLTIEAKQLRFDNERISGSNETTNQSLTVCLAINAGISRDLIDVADRNKTAVKNLEDLKIEYDKKIQSTKQTIQPVTSCDNEFIDDGFADFMREN